MTYEGLRLKVRNKIYLPLTYKIRKKQLKQTSFTIISNNCWAGTIYESYGLKKQTPTVGMFIMPEDYLKMINNLRYYLSDKCQLQIIHPTDSKWKQMLESKSNWATYPIAKLDDIELHLLHYHGSEEEIVSQWKRRIERIDWEHILIKFNDQNGCTEENISRFFEVKEYKKIFFSSNTNAQLKQRYGAEFIVLRQPKDLITLWLHMNHLEIQRNLVLLIG